MRDTRIKPGQRLSPATEFKPGAHWRPHGKHRERDWLHHEYVERGRSTGDIARELGFTDGAVIFWLRRHGIPRRTVSQARGLKHWTLSGAANGMFGRFGAANPNYIDGSSPERQRSTPKGKPRSLRCSWTSLRTNPPTSAAARPAGHTLAANVAPASAKAERTSDPHSRTLHL